MLVSRHLTCLLPPTRVIYWTDWGSSPKVEKANYDGSNRQTLVSTQLQLPNGLELDRNGKKTWTQDGFIFISVWLQL